MHSTLSDISNRLCALAEASNEQDAWLCIVVVLVCAAFLVCQRFLPVGLSVSHPACVHDAAIKFDQVNTAAYSPRPNTPAALWSNQVDLFVFFCFLFFTFTECCRFAQSFESTLCKAHKLALRTGAGFFVLGFKWICV